MNEQNSFEDFYNSLLAGDRSKSSAIASELLNYGISIKHLYEKIIRNSLYDIGKMWAEGKISVATEHMASAIVEAILNDQYPQISAMTKNNKTVIAACAENESHQIGLKMVADIFELNGWDAIFLGANTPKDDLLNFMKLRKPDALALSLSLDFNIPTINKTLESARNSFPAMPIIVGGQAFSRFNNFVLPDSNTFLIKRLDDVEQFAKSFN